MKFKRIMMVIIIMTTCVLVITGCTKEKESEITPSQDENVVENDENQDYDIIINI